MFVFGHRLVLPPEARWQREQVCSGICWPPRPPPAPPRGSRPPCSLCHPARCWSTQRLKAVCLGSSVLCLLSMLATVACPSRLSSRVPSSRKPLKISSPAASCPAEGVHLLSFQNPSLSSCPKHSQCHIPLYCGCCSVCLLERRRTRKKEMVGVVRVAILVLVY